MKVFLLISFFATSAFAADRFELDAACKAKLNSESVILETKRLHDNNDPLASELKGEVYLSYYPDKPDVNITVRVEDEADGRSVDYRANVQKTEAAKCNISLVRVDESACRYSKAEGPYSLAEIPGVKFIDGDSLLPDQKLSELTESQIQAFLGGNSEEPTTAAELIRGTDDEEVTTGTLTLPGGRVLSYMQAYGGDNPFGIFFEQGTTTPAGSNSDGWMCVTP